MFSAAPIPPKHRLGTNHERVQPDTHLPRLCSGVSIPLALLAQLTGTTVAKAGCIHQPQAPISLWPPLLENECPSCWTAQCSIRLEWNILPGEATCFPGQRGGSGYEWKRRTQNTGDDETLGAWQ